MPPNGRPPSHHRTSASSHYPAHSSAYLTSPPPPTTRRRSFSSAEMLTRHAMLRNAGNQMTLQPMNIVPNPRPFSPPEAPYTYTIPLPPQTSAFCPEIHPVLRPGYVDLDLNISQSQLWHHLRNGQSRLSKSMDEPATYPSVPSMTVQHPDLPWSITIHASGMCGQAVGVADVVQTICRMVQMPLTEHDLSAMFEPRPSLSWVGVNRLELLRGKTRLVGFEKSNEGGEIWEMVVV